LGKLETRMTNQIRNSNDEWGELRVSESFSATAQKYTGCSREQYRCARWFGDGANGGQGESVGEGEGIEGGDVGLGDGDSGARVALTEVGGEGAEITSVDRGAVQEISLVPIGDAEAEIGGEDAEIGAVDDAVEVGIAEKGVFDFDLAAGKSGNDAICAVGEADGVAEAVGGRFGGGGDYSGAVPIAVVVAGFDVTSDSGNGVWGRSIIYDDLRVGHVKYAIARNEEGIDGI
jgi:hypothetical protein